MSRRTAVLPPEVPLLSFGQRIRAWLNMLFVDHSIFRFIYNTRMAVTPELHRCGHPMPYQLRGAQRAGIKTVLSLRGNETHLGSNQLEWDTCKRIGLNLVHFPIGSRSAPQRDEVLEIINLLETLPKPLLIHCKSGADRAGMVSTIWQLLRGESFDTAMRQLDFWRHGHIKAAKTGVLDQLFYTYRDHVAAHPGTTFPDWVANHYDPVAVTASFKSNFWANQLVDRILRRE
ncbi:fused DSP-PTPase phosphatase/NAD kinase-like protein [Nevskia ramosa]|uniref:fused DSP-PTPase phosphatase/NAD kinase-like protein n=1 Tax=Nevskia ramosa TaxID=64002 RepID=UPI0003B78BE6|nr:sulfur transferase domain-containing protein [Nevskia ramosa]